MIRPPLLALCGLALFSGCAVNPVSGRPEAVLTTEARELERDAEGAKQVEAEFGLVDSPALASYVDQIGQRLAALSPRQGVPYRFHVVEMALPNAFALPGGNIYVSRGLLTLVNSEDELANVIGHEIGHVAARHAARQQVRSAVFLPAKIAGGLGGFATSIVSPRLGRLLSGIAQLPGALALATYSRGQETEADRLGQELAARAGWNPDGMASFMTTLAREEALMGGDPERLSFFASHPASPARSAESLKFAKTLTKATTGGIAPNHEAFLRHLDGLVVGENAAGGVFIENRFLQPAIGIALEFPKKWETRNTASAVIARGPEKKRFVVLNIAAKGDDPLAASREVSKRKKFETEPRALKIGNLAAARATTPASGDDPQLHVTWIAHEGTIYQVTGVAPSETFVKDTPIFDAASGSFHPLTSAERKTIKEPRLRLAKAAAGETLPALLERTSSSWSPDEAAVANGVEVDISFRAGTLVKHAHPEAYVGP